MRKLNDYKNLQFSLCRAFKAYGFKGYGIKTAEELTEAAIQTKYPPIPEKILFGHDTDIILNEVDWSQKKMDNFLKAQKKARINWASYLYANVQIKGFGPFRYGGIGMMLGGKKSPQTIKRMIKLQTPKKQGYIQIYANHPKGIGNWTKNKFEEAFNYENMIKLINAENYVPKK